MSPAAVAAPVRSCGVSEDAPRRVWPEVMLVEEAADYLRTTTRSLRRLAREGKVPARKVGGEWRFHRLALEDYFRQPQPQGDLDDDPDDLLDDAGDADDSGDAQASGRE